MKTGKEVRQWCLKIFIINEGTQIQEDAVKEAIQNAQPPPALKAVVKDKGGNQYKFERQIAYFSKVEHSLTECRKTVH